MTSDTAPSSSDTLFKKFFIGALCVLAVFCILMPRALNVLPALVAVIALVLWRRSGGKWADLKHPAFLWAGALLALMFATALWSVDAAGSLERAVKMLPIFLGGAALVSLSRLTGGTYFRAWFPFAVLAALTICVIELYAGSPFYHLVHERPGAAYAGNLFYLNRSVALAVLMLAPALTCVRLLPWPRGHKIAMALALALGTAAMLYKTDSQSAQLAFFFAAPLYFFFPVRIKAAWIMLAVVLATGIFAAPYAAQAMFTTLPAFVQEGSFLQRGYVLNRLEIWDFVARRAMEQPFFGHGIEAARAIKDFDSAQLYEPSREIMHPHNFVLQIWLEMGALGALYAALFFATILRRLKNFEPLQARTALAVLFGAISVASTGYGLWQGMWIGAYGMLCAFCILAARPYSEK